MTISETGAGQSSPDRALRQRHFALSCDVERSYRYHAHRRAFFDTLHRFTMLGVVICGSAVMADGFGDAKWFGAIAGLLAALDMVYSYSNKARDHEFLYRRLMELSSRLAIIAPGTDAALDEIDRLYHQILADEPPPYRAVNALCHNEVMLRHGKGQDWLVDLTWWQRRMMHLVRFETEPFPVNRSRQTPAGA